ncbi:hypothetical protein HYPSUDRAFT_33631 [Hypholoma sublateritium FD-334 SS-4]|uniref:DUF6534 domain-containing protein n=1 Tax=Hypholoma sublateritium (strain FD-334 SS-4) TaxID=945553 RepID=A0A0D2PBR2_HYPSF|nr:hypothetical protein HYPSUDRAFT_33631 [Hypholoma sublateritium FD-334 SS-4]
MHSYSGTYGALLLGGLFASGFSGFVALQSLLYFKLFPNDGTPLKSLVLIVWAFDLAHTALVWASLWDYMITNIANVSYGEYIPETIALTIVLTAILTFLTQCFFAHRIFHLSRRNWYITAPVVILAVGRLACACVSGAEMIEMQYFENFRAKFRWLFSMGLALSSGADILITALLFILLRKSKADSVSLDDIIDACILYTFEIGSLTSVTTVVSLICWVVLDDSLIFLGLHFLIGKLYANSLLASLNSRQRFRRSRATVTAFDLLSMPHIQPLPAEFQNTHNSRNANCGVQVDVIKSVQYDVETGKE